MKTSSVILPGQRYGRLTVVQKQPKERPGGHDRWLCECICGNTTVVQSRCLRSGATKSCGCLNDETRKRLKTKHGQFGTPEYKAWRGMKDRCLNPNHTSYDSYGGRGIAVCERWLAFENFFADMGKKPSPKHSLDRIDNSGNYEPSNCRWVVSKVQANNRRSNTLVTFRGEEKSISEWATAVGLPYNIVLTRINNGWAVEDALTTPKGAVRRYARKT